VQTELRIGEVAKRSSVSIDTVRYYERRRLLPEVRRTAGGYRVFTPESVDRVLFIKQAQELGFSLEEIGVLLTDRDCVRIRDLLDVKVGGADEVAAVVSRKVVAISRRVRSRTKGPSGIN
jgi:MerR family mercuric resistance operon transcriptional regulator